MPILLLVRHADAGPRGTGASDVHRTLSARGRRQALALVDLLVPLLTDPTRGSSASTDEGDASAACAVTVRSSPAERCHATVTPLATALGTHVELDDRLFEGADVGALLDRALALTGPTVWSSHGDVIPALLRLVALRGVVLRTAGGNLVPLFLALKNEPEGRNVRWESYRDHILAWQDAALADIRAGAFAEA